MCANDAGRRREIVRVAVTGGGCDLGDRDGRRIGGEDGVWGTDLGELAEDGRFQGGNLGNSFDDEVGSGEVAHLRRGGEARSRSLGVGF